ncbi:MAG: polymer-forming cytoskeletal protein [Gemmatimonadaceae bacterium]|nr:polymer-forming cytoskeletal protein [Gemmatimonadaceae bacterium]
MRAGENTLSIVSAGTTICGDIECSGVLKVEGRIEGSVRKARQVMLAKEGAIQGDVIAGEVVVGGVIDGAVTATERLELQHTAVVNGDITTRSIVVMEGARINGGLKMTEIALVTGAEQPSDSREAKIARRS